MKPIIKICLFAFLFFCIKAPQVFTENLDYTYNSLLSPKSSNNFLSEMILGNSNLASFEVSNEFKLTQEEIMGTETFGRYSYEIERSNDSEEIMNFARYYLWIMNRDPFLEIYPLWKKLVNFYRSQSDQKKTFFLQEIGRSLTIMIMNERKTNNICFHLNRSEMPDHSYVASGGLIYDWRGLVFFYQAILDKDTLIGETLYDIVTKEYEGSRMGDTVVIFDLNGPRLQEAFKAGAILKRSDYSRYLEVKDKKWFAETIYGKPKQVNGFGLETQQVVISHKDYLSVPIHFGIPFSLRKKTYPGVTDEFLLDIGEENLAEMLYIAHLAINYPIPQNDTSEAEHQPDFDRWRLQNLSC